MKQHTLYDDRLRKKDIDPKQFALGGYHNSISVTRNKGSKNDGIKHVVRGNIHRLNHILTTKNNQVVDEYRSQVLYRLHNIPYKEKPCGIYICCPYHGEKNPSMMITKNPERLGLCKCYGCGKTISFTKMVHETKCKPAKLPVTHSMQHNENDLDYPF